MTSSTPLSNDGQARAGTAPAGAAVRRRRPTPARSPAVARSPRPSLPNGLSVTAASAPLIGNRASTALFTRLRDRGPAGIARAGRPARLAVHRNTPPDLPPPLTKDELKKLVPENRSGAKAKPATPEQSEDSKRYLKEVRNHLEQVKKLKDVTEFKIGQDWKGMDIPAHRIQGRSKDSSDVALVIAGVHGSEASGVDVANRLLAQLQNSKNPPPYFTVILVPTLFPSNLKARMDWVKKQKKQLQSNVGRLSKSGSLDPNRQFPRLMQDLDPDNPVDSQGRVIEPSNLSLMALIDTFKPKHMVSIHAIQSASRAGIYADPHAESLSYQVAADMAALGKEMVDESGNAEELHFKLKYLREAIGEQEAQRNKLDQAAKLQFNEDLVKRGTAMAEDMELFARNAQTKEQAEKRKALIDRMRALVSKISSTSSAMAIADKMDKLASKAAANVHTQQQAEKAKDAWVPGNKPDSKGEPHNTLYPRQNPWNPRERENMRRDDRAGVSLGQWASSRDIGVITVEVRGQETSGDDPNKPLPAQTGGARSKELEAHATAIREILLGPDAAASP